MFWTGVKVWMCDSSWGGPMRLTWRYTRTNNIYIYMGTNLNHPQGIGDSSVVRAPDSWLKGREFESPQERRENFLLQGRLSVLTLISVSVPPRKRYLTYVALHDVTWSMVVWCTQNLRRDGCSFMWHQPCQRCKYTTSVDNQKNALKKRS